MPPQGVSVEDSEVDSGLNSGVGFKHIDFCQVFQCLWAIGFILEDSEVDSGMNSGVGFKSVDFSMVFQRFWAATGLYVEILKWILG